MQKVSINLMGLEVPNSRVFHQSTTDALSVFSSFTTNASASGNPTTSTSTQTNSNTAGSNGGVAIALGKLFATGVAAQNLSEGMDYYLAYKGAAEMQAGMKTCIERLIDAKNAKVPVPDDKLPTCLPPTEESLVATEKERQKTLREQQFLLCYQTRIAKDNDESAARIACQGLKSSS